MNGACTCTLVKDGDTGNFVGRKGKKKKSRREIPPLQSSVFKNQQPDLLTFCCVAWLNIVEYNCLHFVWSILV